MNTRHALLTVLTVTVTTACDDSMVEPSLLDAPRILATRAEPRTLQPGAPGTMRAITHDVDELNWTSCTIPWVFQADRLRCPGIEQAVGSGISVEWTVPDGVDALWIAAGHPTDTRVVPAIHTLEVGDVIDNPSIESVGVNGEPLPRRPRVGERLVIDADVLDPIGQGVVTTYFTTAGRFDPWRTYDGRPSTLVLPDEPGEVILTMVVRDVAGGVGWHQETLEVTP